jgi:hypothetical protein
LNAENAITALKTQESNREEITSLLKIRDEYAKLETKILESNEELDLKDYILLYTGGIVSRNIICKNIETWTAVVKEYDDNLLPKLKEVTGTVDKEKRELLIEEFFSEEKI